jgi:hypothetical protein
MQGVIVTTETKSADVSVVVVRCGCGRPETHNGSESCLCGQTGVHAATGQEHVCPNPRLVTDLGVVSHFVADASLQKKWNRTQKPLADKRIAASNKEAKKHGNR